MQLSVNGDRRPSSRPAAGNSMQPNRPWCCCTAPASITPPGRLHSRWFAHHGYSVLAPDLPGHGRSSGAAARRPLPEMADWTAALLDAAGVTKAWLVGHSMGSLIAIETAARHPSKVSALSLIGTAATMTVGPDLLKAAEANDISAIDMVSIWGLGFQAELGGSLAPGLWMHSGAQRVLGRCRPGVLFNDLSACNTYQGATGRGRADQCSGHAHPRRTRSDDTRARPARRSPPHCRMRALVVLRGAGHMMMAERPDELLQALSGA